MGALYRLKAYFGMVPAEDMGGYDDEPLSDRYPERRGAREYADDRWDERYDYDPEPYERDGYDRAERAAARVGAERGAGGARTGGAYERDEPGGRYDGEWDRRRTGTHEAVRAGGAGATVGATAVRGSLAVDPDVSLREPVRLSEQVPVQRDRGAAALARITTLQPRSYNEARTIGERYRDGVPVIMNLTELDDAAAKRLVDFAAGLAFALRGSIDKVTNRVFLLTPADVEVSADDARKLAERGLFRQD
ncbi:MAG TPA: cell division protein SepF [Pseudonocardia sp.]|nr:cell division protein SepF [Pseudonocardia sp.]